jgi:Ser/Thr protein kinase RdoA (MazF antagonist)
MRAYEELTEQGKIRRLHGLARAALDFYDIPVQRLSCIARDTNTTFRVDAADGARFALRVGAPPTDTNLDIDTEMAWLDALARETSIAAARPLRNRYGDFVSVVEQESVPHARRCVLFRWLPGKVIGESADREDYQMLGVLAARLHDHGEKWRMPPSLRPLVWDRVFYYPGEPVVLFGPDHSDLMTPRRAEIVRSVIARCDAELARLHREVPVSVLHGDLHPRNVLRDGDRLHVFDFEDVMIGAPAQDIAITLFYNRDHDDYVGLRSAFVRGYTSLRPWPVEFEGQLELLMAARTVMFINYVLRMGFDPENYVPMAVDRISGVL